MNDSDAPDLPASHGQAADDPSAARNPADRPVTQAGRHDGTAASGTPLPRATGDRPAPPPPVSQPVAGELTGKTDLTPPRLQYPCDYPVKVVARTLEGVRTHLDALVERHAGPLDLTRVAERASAQKNFVSITYTIQARGPEQIAQLFEALKQYPPVLLVL